VLVSAPNRFNTTSAIPSKISGMRTNQALGDDSVWFLAAMVMSA
jgi:hypothetical protein